MSEIRLGICSEETETFIGTLSRYLDSQLARIATHIFFKKNAVLMFNRSRVEELEGDYTRFDAVFEGKGERMNWPGERSLFLKSNYKIMLVWNKSDDLKNGSMGTFKKVVDDKLLMEFEKVGTVLIERVTWNQRNRQGEIIGSVTQFPVILAFFCNLPQIPRLRASSGCFALLHGVCAGISLCCHVSSEISRHPPSDRL